ncbi:PKD domain-containing protein [Halocola ammonii]
MEDGTVSTCDGAFVDDGLGSPYTDQGYTFTICPDNPGDVIQIEFVAFNVHSVGNNNDWLQIYDGDSPGANSLGSYTGTDLQGLEVTGTVNNTTGCLTFVWNPNSGNPNDLPGWEGIISCTTPCAQPTAAYEIVSPEPDGDQQTISVCLDEEITFGDAGSQAGPGFSIENWIWNFDDGTVETLDNGGDITHSFSEPGEYIVNLTVEDDNGCQSLNLEPLQVLVSTLPEIEIDSPSPACMGNDLEISVDAESTTWTALPPQVVAGETYLADGAGFSYTSSLNFDFFEAGATLESCDDLIEITTNMEHSYMGDLQIEIACPDGTSVILVPYPNGGGGTYIGEPIDGDATPTPGVGYDYSWAPDATTGTWSDNAGDIGFGGSLPAGEYEAEGDLCELVGCPLNGEWTFTIVDNLAIDNGYIFEWGISFNPELYPGVTTFTPHIGPGADSSYVEGPGVIETSDDGNTFTVSYDTAGVYEYTFFTINDFGCTFDTTFQVEAVPSPPITTIEDGVACDPQYEIGYPYDTTGFESLGCPWVIEMFDSFGDGWNGNELEVYVNGTLQDTYTITNIQSDFNQEEFYTNFGDDVEIVFSTGAFVSEVSYNIYDPDGNLVVEVGQGEAAAGTVYDDVSNFTCDNPTFDIPFTVEWSPANLFNNPNAQYGVANLEEGINNITVTLTYQEEPFCSITEEFALTYGLEIGTSPDTTICIGGTAELTASPTNAQFDDVDYIWNDGEYTGQTIEVSGFTEPTTFEVYAEYADGCQTETQTVTVDFYEPLEMAPFDTILSCPGLNIEVGANTVTGGLGDYDYVWNYDGNEYPGDSILVETGQSTAICLTVTDECETPPVEECQQLIFEEPLDVQFEADTTQGCIPLEINFTAIPSEDLWTDATWEIEPSSVYTQESPTHVFEEPGVYDVGLTLVSNLGCEYSNSYSNYITAFANPTAAFNATPQPTEIPDSEISFTDLSIGNIVEYEWVFDTLDVLGVSSEQNPIFEFPYDVGDTYPVTLTVTDENNCTDQITRDIVVNDIFNVYVPTAFTPNGDGVNDVWRIEGTDIDPNDFRLEIYNRWGEQVFVTEDKSEYWEGEHQHGNYYVPDGVYTWRLVAHSLATSDKKELSGTVTIIR